MNTKYLVAGVGGLVAVVALLAFVVSPLLFSGPDDDVHEPIESAIDADKLDDRLADDDEDDEGDEAELVSETFEVFDARDPFQQLVVEEESFSPAADGGGGDGDVGGDGDGDGDDDGDGDSQPSSSATVSGTTFRLVEVYEDSSGESVVQVTVNDTGYDVTEGDDFAGRFRLLEVDDPCATFLYGDQRFTLCEGESILK